MADDKKDNDDATMIGGGPPVIPKLPGAPPPAAAAPPAGQGDVTSGPAMPPVIPPKAPPPPSPKAPVDDDATVIAGAPAAEASDEDATMIVRPAANRPRFALRHEQPPGHTGTTVLTRDAYLAGRSPSSDLRLYSPGASREHARLSLRAGAWYLAPCEGKSVLVNGEAVRAEVRLTHKMRLQLGDDELLVIDQAAPVESAPATAGTSGSGSGARTWIIVALAAAVAIAAAVVWVMSRG